jgi:gamma-glutamyltranspeptidase/glutathione hydrolase
MGEEFMVASGHPNATLAGTHVLKKGGNAVDAGVAIGLCLDVTQPDIVNFGGVAPMLIYDKNEDKIFNIDGLGTWPKKATIDELNRLADTSTWTWTTSQDNFLSSIVPAAPDAWIKALDQFGTMTFSEVASYAIKLAERGFPAHPLYINTMGRRTRYRQWEYTNQIFFPSGETPELGELIIQKDLAKTMKKLVKVETKNKGMGRHKALIATRDEFYKGSIAKEISKHLQENGGLMTYEDLENYEVSMEQPVKTTYRGIDVYCCGPWCQGPVNNIALNILENFSPTDYEHNSAKYLHLIASSLELAFSDREKYFGDPNFVDVPIDALISKEYARLRKELINLKKAWGKMPPFGDPVNMKKVLGNSDEIKPNQGSSFSYDTSYEAVIDKDGNAFSATPSDGGRLVPGLGICISPRGPQSWLDPKHPSSVFPGKRPRLTPNPAMSFKDGELFMVYGTPGSDAQPQAMVQLFVNVVDFDMNLQEAIEAPRIKSDNYPASAWPHNYTPGLLNVEGRIDEKTRKTLTKMGYQINVYKDWAWECGGVCAIINDTEKNIKIGGADPRRGAYAIGW